MTLSIFDATTLGYMSGIVAGLIVVALVVSLTAVNLLVASVGGSRRGHVPSIATSLEAVGDSTGPVPATLASINNELAELAAVLAAVEGHLSVARQIFDAVAESA